LIDNLGDEKLRWKELGDELGLFYISLTGDVLLSSGLIAYLGAFTSKYRSDIAEEWVTKVKDINIP
jgi:dynein heavy chain